MSDNSEFVQTSQCAMCSGTVINGECQQCGHSAELSKRVDKSIIQLNSIYGKLDTLDFHRNIAQYQALNHELHSIGRDIKALAIQRDWLLAELDAANAELAKVQAERDALRQDHHLAELAMRLLENGTIAIDLATKPTTPGHIVVTVTNSRGFTNSYELAIEGGTS
jgi:hypothetical protein